MTFRSILFKNEKDGAVKEAPEAPGFFVDLNLDQVVDAIAAGREEYNLRPFFYAPLKDATAVEYRQEVMRDLESPALFEQIQVFAQAMRTMREYLALADKLYHKHQKEWWFLAAVELYLDSVADLFRNPALTTARSASLSAFRDYLRRYIESDRFGSLRAETKKLKADLAEAKYSIVVKDTNVTVRKYEPEPDYSVEVENLFEKFKQGAARDYRIKFRKRPEMNGVEERVLDFVAKLYPDIFSRLDEYRARHGDYLDETLARFDREIQFYIAYLEYIAVLKQTGLKFCYPQIADTAEVYDYEGFDLALARSPAAQGAAVVRNDFHLRGKERVIVVTGPNQGGKTTFARFFGQVHYLAALGCPVPGVKARLVLFDRLFSHFEKEEKVEDLTGKLHDELTRIRRMLDRSTPKSIIIMNEIFTSTTVSDALFLSKEIMKKIVNLGALAVWVTFIDELASLGEETVSMVAAVDPANPEKRTYKIERKPADGFAYAIAIAKKYKLTHDDIKERL